MYSIVKMIGFFSRKPRIDNFVFWIHYRVTFVMLLIFAIIVGYRVYWKRPMNCTTRDDIDDVSARCLLESTHIIKDDWEKEVGSQVLAPGIGKFTPGQEEIYYDNYNYVFLVLCVQAIVFYLPRFFWKRVEGGKMFFLTQALRSPFLPDDEKESKKRFIAEYLASNKNNNTSYFVFYVLAELLNFLNVVIQLIFMNAFWGQGFSWKVLKYATNIWQDKGRSDTLLQLFPRYTICKFYTFGSSGDIRYHNALCFMSVNSLYEKIYVFLWFWCLILAVISFLILVCRALTILPRFRSTITFFRARMVKKGHLENFVRICDLGDWLILDLLAINLDPLTFRDIVEHFSTRVGLKRNDDSRDENHLL